MEKFREEERIKKEEEERSIINENGLIDYEEVDRLIDMKKKRHNRQAC